MLMLGAKTKKWWIGLRDKDKRFRKQGCGIMTDNKLKDNEIIKALKCVPKDVSGYITDENNKMKLVYNEDVIDLINRLQSQNKDLAETVHNLTIKKDALFDKAEELKAEIKRLNALVKTKNKLIEGLDQSISYAYDRAIKEFAERLKDEIINDTAYACDSTQHSGYYDYHIKIGDIPEYIDNLAKEMVGEDK